MIVVINVMTYSHFEYSLFYFIHCHTGTYCDCILICRSFVDITNHHLIQLICLGKSIQINIGYYRMVTNRIAEYVSLYYTSIVLE